VLQEDADSIFKLIAVMHGDPHVISKTDLVLAHGGSFRPFERIETDSEGLVQVEDWHGWLGKCRDERGKGVQWLHALLTDFHANAQARLDHEAKAEATATQESEDEESGGAAVEHLLDSPSPAVAKPATWRRVGGWMHERTEKQKRDTRGPQGGAAASTPPLTAPSAKKSLWTPRLLKQSGR